MSAVFKPLINGGGGLVTQSCPTLCDPVGCSLPGFSVHRILQARILEWVAISFSRASSQPRDQTQVSCIACRFFTSETPGKPTYQWYFCYSSLNGLRLCYSKTQQTMTPQSIVPILNRLWSLGDVLVISFLDLASHSQPHQGHYHMSLYPLHGIYHHIPKFIPVPEILQDCFHNKVPKPFLSEDPSDIHVSV